MSRIFNCADKRQKEALLAVLKVNPDLKIEFYFQGRWVRRSINLTTWGWTELSEIPYRLAEAKDESDI